VFTGLVEAKGKMARVRRAGGAARLRVTAPFAGELSRGESVAVDGVCLTVAAVLPGAFEAEAVERTVATTTLRTAAPGTEVNLERALRLGDRLGGHMVTGHVDGVAVVERVAQTANGRDLTLRVPADLMRHVVARGSIAIDGVSLTVAAVDGTSVTVSLIPETLEATTLGGLRSGARVNVETDVAAKYRESAEADVVGRTQDAERGEGITMDKLRKLGFTE
jgi:riboflavin synthase